MMTTSLRRDAALGMAFSLMPPPISFAIQVENTSFWLDRQAPGERHTNAPSTSKWKRRGIGAFAASGKRKVSSGHMPCAPSAARRALVKLLPSMNAHLMPAYRAMRTKFRSACHAHDWPPPIS